MVAEQPDFHEIDAYIEAYWPRLAGIAWRFYMRNGRGVVIVPLSAVEAAATERPTGFNRPSDEGRGA